MKNKYTPFIVVGILLLALIGYFAYTQSANYRWRMGLTPNGKQPYDLSIFYKLLNKGFDRKDFDERIEKELPTDSTAENSTYLYIGSRPFHTLDEAWHLRDYVNEGGTAFLICKNVPDTIADLLIAREDCGLNETNTPWDGRNYQKRVPKVQAAFTHPGLGNEAYQFDHVYNKQITEYPWSYMPLHAFCEIDAATGAYPRAILGNLIVEGYEYPNFARLQVGKGYVYLHTNPIMFTNLFMVTEGGYEYVNSVLAHISTKTVFWDRESAKRPPNEQKFDMPEERRAPPQTPMEYIFSQDPLRWSWYLILLMGLVFMLFRAKRRQRVVSVLAPNTNTSIEFIETIGRLYFQQQDHKNILKKQMQIFLAHIRQRYHLLTSELDEKLINRIAIRAQIDEEIVQAIFDEYFRLAAILNKNHLQIKVEELNNFYLLIENFHKAVEENKFSKDKVVQND